MDNKKQSFKFKIALVSFLIAVVLFVVNKSPVKEGECYILDGGAWQDKLVRIVEVGKHSALAKDTSGKTYRINKNSSAHEIVDCFNSF